MTTTQQKTATPYLDNQSTTRIDPRVRQIMMAYHERDYGDPANQNHASGRGAAVAVDVARSRIARLVDANEGDEIFFTSGPEQSAILALGNAATYLAASRSRIITSVHERAPIERALARLDSAGVEVVRLSFDAHGAIAPAAVAQAIDDNTFLVSLALVQEESGVIAPIAEIARIARERGVLVHLDASQGLGLIPAALGGAGIDLATIAAHGMHGPRGVGALYVSRRVLDRMPDHYHAWVVGDPPNVPGVVGLGEAAHLRRQEGRDEAERLRALGERLCARLRAAALEFIVVGTPAQRVPGHLLIAIPELDATQGQRLRDAIGCSGAALAPGQEPGLSRTLLALGHAEDVANNALRIGIGRFDGERDIDSAAERIIQAVHEARASANAPASATRTLVNCEGKTVTIADGGYTQFCAISNTRNFLADLGAHALDAIVALGRPERVSVVIPSYRSNHRLAATLLALLEQEHEFATEILVLINEPADAEPGFRAANDATESWIRGLTAGSAEAPATFAARHAEVRAALERAADMVRLRCVRQAITGGMPTVYQTILSSYMARARGHADALGGTRSQILRRLDELMARTFLLICDDDLVLLGRRTLASAYYHAVVHDAVVLGQLRLRKTVRADPEERCVHDLMESFLEVKYDIGVNALGPRGMVLRQALEAGPVTLDDPFGDQLYFARIAAAHRRHLVAGRTFIEAAEYPSNGRMWRDLLGYLRGQADAEAIERSHKIFANVIELARARNHAGRYSIADMETLLRAIQTRDVAEIDRVTEELRARALVDAMSHADDAGHGAERIARRAHNNREAWTDERVSAAWGRHAASMGVLLDQADQALLHAVDARPGESVLDLASGVGDPALRLAAAVAPSGIVIGTDIAPGMLRMARERAATVGVDNVLFRLADVHDLPFDDHAFDAVTARFGIMYFAHPERALAEIARVLRPGGRLVLMAWGSPEQPYFRHTRGIIASHVATPPDPDGPNTFAYAEPGSLSAALGAAGLADIVESAPGIELVWPGSGAALWQFYQQMTASLGELVRQEPERWTELGEQAALAFERYRQGDALRIPGNINLARAYKRAP